MNEVYPPQQEKRWGLIGIKLACLAAALVLVALLAGCRESVDQHMEEANRTGYDSVVAVTEKDSGGEVKVKIGQELAVVLTANETTPFKWEYEKKPDEAILSLKSCTYATDIGSEGADGAGGKRTWRYEAKAPGETLLSMVEAEIGGEHTNRRFSVKVIIEP